MQLDSSVHQQFPNLSISSDLLNNINNENKIYTDNDNDNVMSNINNGAIEDSYKIIESYFQGKQYPDL